MDIGFIGLGNMGAAIAANVLKAGHRLTVWNRSAAKADALVAAGATLAKTPAEAARGEIVMTMLADDRAVDAVVFGEHGILRSTAKPIHVSMSTIGVAFADRLAAAHAEAGLRYVAAPVFGRPAAAEAAKLFVLAAGEADAVAACAPVFAAIGQKTFPLGETPSAANVVKLCGNFMIMSVVESLAESMTLAQANGIGKGALLGVLTGTLFGAPIYHNYGRMLVEDDFRPAGFAAPLGLKDMNLVSAAADAARVPMPLLGIVRDHLLATIAQEGDDIDWAGIGKIVAASAGL